MSPGRNPARPAGCRCAGPRRDRAHARGEGTVAPRRQQRRQAAGRAVHLAPALAGLELRMRPDTGHVVDMRVAMGAASSRAITSSALRWLNASTMSARAMLERRALLEKRSSCASSGCSSTLSQNASHSRAAGRASPCRHHQWGTGRRVDGGVSGAHAAAASRPCRRSTTGSPSTPPGFRAWKRRRGCPRPSCRAASAPSTPV